MDTYSEDAYFSFMKKLAKGQILEFTTQLNEYLMQSGSVRDFYQEGHYHTFVLGLACGLMHTHHVYSNRESGWGYADMIIVPKKEDSPLAIIFEFKHVKKPQPTRADQLSALQEAAEEGFQQITLKRYEMTLAQHTTVTQVVKVGMAFCGKVAGACYQSVHLKAAHDSPIQWCLPELQVDS